MSFAPIRAIRDSNAPQPPHLHHLPFDRACPKYTLSPPGLSGVEGSKGRAEGLTAGFTGEPFGELKAALSTGDAVGNRTAMTTTTPLSGTVVTTYTFDAANCLTSVGGVSYNWDARGNLLSDSTFTYAYNTAGQMVQAENAGVTLVYTYNADGLRVAQSVHPLSHPLTNFAWD